MGVDLVGRLVFGVSVDDKGKDGRTFRQRIQAGEWGEYDEASHGTLEAASWELELDVEILEAVDNYDGTVEGAVAGKELMIVGSRDFQVQGGQSLSELATFARATQGLLDRYGLGKGSYYLIQYAG